MVKYCVAVLSWMFFICRIAYAQPLLQNKNVNLVFDVYNKNMHVVVIKAVYQLLNDQYKVTAHFASAGLVSFFVNLDMVSSVQGKIQARNLLPGLFESKGISKGEKFMTLIDFHHGQKTEIKTLFPEKEKKRDSLTQNQIEQSLDIMSAMMELTHRVGTENSCDDQFKIFDGIRVFTFHSQTIGTKTLPSNWTSPYRGQALLCNAVEQQIGGLKQSRHRMMMAQPQPVYLWFKRIDSIGMLPVRFEIDHPKMGRIIIILRKIQAE